MRKILLIWAFFMVFAVWAAAQSSPKATPWWSQFKALPLGAKLDTETPSNLTPTATYTLTSSPSPTPAIPTPTRTYDTSGIIISPTVVFPWTPSPTVSPTATATVPTNPFPPGTVTPKAQFTSVPASKKK